MWNNDIFYAFALEFPGDTTKTHKRVKSEQTASKPWTFRIKIRIAKQSTETNQLDNDTVG